MDRQDFVIMSNLSEAVIDEEAMRINGVAILGKYSYNAKNEIRREYSNTALQNAVSIFEGAPAFIDHRPGKQRSLTEKYGVYKNVRLENDTVKGDLDLFESDAAKLIMSMAKKDPAGSGNSITASGRIITKGKWPIVEEIFGRTKEGFKSSVDMVIDPATTKTIYENKEDGMDYKDLTVENLKENRSDLYDQIVKVGVDSKVEEITTLKEDRDALKVKVDEFEVKERIAQKRKTVDKLIEESKLPKEAVTDVFVENLMSIEESESSTFEAQAKNLISDRKSVLGGVKANTERTEITESKRKELKDAIKEG